MGRFECSSIKEGFFIGIVYRYTNRINGTSYIGKTINPEQRHRAHMSSSRNPKDPSYNNPFPRAIRKYGIESFDYSVLFESEDESELFEAELRFIRELKESQVSLYNITEGGEGRSHTEEERKRASIQSRFKNASLTEKDVIDIRLAYLRGEQPSEVWKRYPSFTNYYSFMNVWTGERYGYVMPEVFEKRGSRVKLNREKAEKIRELYRTGEFSYDKLSDMFSVSRSTIRDVIKRRTFK